MLTVFEVADRFRVCPRTVRRWRREGKLVGVRLPGTKHWLFERGYIERLVKLHMSAHPCPDLRRSLYRPAC